MQFSSKRVNHAERCEIRIAQIPSVFKELAIVFIPRPCPEAYLARGRPRAPVPRLRQTPDPHSESPPGSGQGASQGRNPVRAGKNPSRHPNASLFRNPPLPQRGRGEKQNRPDQARSKPGTSQNQARTKSVCTSLTVALLYPLSPTPIRAHPPQPPHFYNSGLDKIRVLLYDIRVFLNKVPGLFNPISTERRKRCDHSNSS